MSITIPTELDATALDATPTPTRWNGVTWVVAASLLSFLPISVLHVTRAAEVQPLLDPISYYALVPGGYPLLLLGCILLSAAGAGLAIWLARSGLPGVRLPVGLLGSFVLAFVLVGVFPTDPIDAEVASVSATIHRIAATWGVLVVPAVGVLVGRRSAATARSALPARLVRLAAWVAGAMALFFAIHIPLAVMGSRIPAFGLLERAGFALVISYLIMLAMTVRREGYRSRAIVSVGSHTERRPDHQEMDSCADRDRLQLVG